MNLKIRLLARLLLATLFFIFSSCEKDLYEEAIIQQKNELSVTKVSLLKLSKTDNAKLFKAVNNLNLKNENILSKKRNNIKSDFYFDETNGSEIISADGHKSYTFQIYNKNVNKKIENVLFTENENGEYDVFKVKYDFNEEDYKKLDKKDILKHKVVYEPIIYARTTEFCLTIYTIYSSGCTITHENEYNCNDESITSEQYCAEDYSNITSEYSNDMNNSQTGWGNGTFVNSAGNPITTINPGGVFTTLVITPGMTFINSLNFDTPDGLFSLSTEAQQIIFNHLDVHNFDDPTTSRVKYVLEHFNFFWINEQPVGTDISIFTYFAQKNYFTESHTIVSNWITLKTQLNTTTSLLLNIPCSEIAKWQALINLQIPTSVKAKITTLNNQSLLNDYKIQYLEHASGTTINLDYFPVTINTLPKNPATGQIFTPVQFLNYIRLNINSFIDTTISSFSPTTLNTGYNEAQIWGSTNPLGAILHINIPQPAGDGSVICSETDSNHWIFTTIEVPYGYGNNSDGIHPVSGNREFGLTQNPNGSYIFYTRGVDRMTDGFESIIGENSNILLGSPFDNPDILWNSLKTKIFNFVQNNNGNAQPLSTSPNVIWRPDWYKVRQVLRGEISISDLGCH